MNASEGEGEVLDLKINLSFDEFRKALEARFKDEIAKLIGAYSLQIRARGSIVSSPKIWLRRLEEAKAPARWAFQKVSERPQSKGG